ncbi:MULTISPECIES: alpha-keto acid decarboxylase family protein [unclassified Francisella]|uniref:alpha-keto acid decarboxylase family protein n=1 Tax=unclassified Francisella TaxID=2610885 RepID=UPI002E31BF92|nr:MULTISPECIES: thiamine pyrophosphate-binding protein [unclassified Francisella]MED7819766.1 thiamine pyrophosphate-binding protein [Francisella sp. 19S2-4]MED7830586.1 thiamine pyrophosphate-binding protein [Francisella sp. 19S2-10]
MITIGEYLGQRLIEAGASDFFGVPGDFNLILLDGLLKNRKLKMINCCNELNAGYAAEGYARYKNIGVCVVTHTVGALGAISSIAGAYAENLPVIIISGGPNSNSSKDNEITHHSLGDNNYSNMVNIFKNVTCHTALITDTDLVAKQIDKAIDMAISYQKPVYIEIACNIAGKLIPCPTPKKMGLKNSISDDHALNAATREIAQLLNSAKNPTIIAGSEIRSAKCLKEFDALINKIQYATANMADAKGFIDETYNFYIGTYWGPASSLGCKETIESSDCYIFFGARFSDYITSGHNFKIYKDRTILVGKDFVEINGKIYTNVLMKDVINKLIDSLELNRNALQIYEKYKTEQYHFEEPQNLNSPITIDYLFKHIQKILNENHTIFAEGGDSWFNGMNLKLPSGAKFEIQMMYGSIGWATPSILGYSTAATERRAIGLIGDGAFQLTGQELSTIMRYNKKPIIFLLNNKSYNVEVQIHDGEYNYINNWDYKGFADSLKGYGKCWSVKVDNCKDLLNAIKEAETRTDEMCFIEVIHDPNSFSKELIKWGDKLVALSSREPRKKTYQEYIE